MAIFCGTFLDADGAKWDPSAQVAQTWPAGGRANLTRRGRKTNHSRQAFVASVRTHAALWKFVLTPADRAAWKVQGAAGVFRRGVLDATPVNGFLSYNALKFVHTYDLAPIEITTPGESNVECSAFHIEHVDVNNHTIRVQVPYSAAWADTPFATACFYHVKFRYVPPYDLWRQTRLLYIQQYWDEGGGLLDITASARFRMSTHEYVHVMFRTHDGCRYSLDEGDVYSTWP